MALYLLFLPVFPLFLIRCVQRGRSLRFGELLRYGDGSGDGIYFCCFCLVSIFSSWFVVFAFNPRKKNNTFSDKEFDILLIWSIVYPIVLYFFKISNIDVIPFSTTIGITGNGLIFSNLIPHYKYFFVLRVIIISVLLLVSFILSNYIINKIILIIATNNKQKRLLLCTYPNDEKKIYFNDLQKKIFFWKKHKQNDKAFVETKND